MRKVRFAVSTGYVGSQREEEFTLEELEIIEEDYETEEELENDINEAYNEWMQENIDAGWGFIED